MPDDSTLHQWYVNAETGPQGPFSFDQLKTRAVTHALHGGTELARSPDGPWSPATSLPELELEWRVTPENGDPLPACHILALRGQVENEDIQPYWDVEHVPTGEVYDVVDALCSALLAQNHILEEKLAASPLAEPDPGSEAPRDLRLRADAADREAAKWKRLYDDEIARNEDRERELRRRIEDLRDGQRKTSERIKALERRRRQLEEASLGVKPESLDGGDVPALAYRELQLQMEHLMDSLHLRTRQLERAREKLHELEDELARERSRAREQEEESDGLHQETLEQLTRLEQAHMDLTRSYRDLNDRAIRLNNQRTDADDPEPEAPPAPGPKPSRDSGNDGKLKMT